MTATTPSDPLLPEEPAEWPPRLRWTPAELARFNAWLGNPARCHRKSCQRSRRCLGDPLGCLQTHWRKRPDAAKVWMQSALAAWEAGRTPRAAAGLGDAALVAYVTRTEGLPVRTPRRR
jgi:hypothetical protein